MFLENLDSLIKAKKINKHILAEESGIPYTTIVAFYKKGYENVKLSTLRRLSEYFGVSMDFLVTGQNFDLEEKEMQLIMAYRSHPELQAAVDKLLEVDAGPAPADDIGTVITAALKKDTVTK